MKHPAKIDIAVLILFFNRPDSLKKVFAEVRKALRLFEETEGIDIHPAAGVALASS